MQGKTKFKIIDKSFSLPGTRAGIILVHGFTGSPSELKPLGEFLAQKGYGVFGIRLPGHGTCPEDLVETRWPDWHNAVQKAVEEMYWDYEKVFVIGLSMGGLLSLRVALEFPLAGVVSINSPIFLRNKKLFLLPTLKYIKKFEAKKGVDNFKNRAAYDKIPLRSLSSMMELVNLTKREVLSNVKCPLLILQSEVDQTVQAKKSGQYIFEQAASQRKELIWLEEAGHIATIGKGSEATFHEIERFLDRLS